MHAQLSLSGMTAAEALARGIGELAGCDSPRLDAELLLAHALAIPRGQLFMQRGLVLAADQRAAFESMLARRRQGEPVAYLIGSWEFWSLTLAVNPAVLVPRPDTELLVEWALQLLPAAMPVTVADLGTGSGAIALALAHDRPQAHVHAVDASAAALHVARSNAQSLGLHNLEFQQADFAAFLGGPAGLDLIVSNPPYIANNDPHLPDLRHEPAFALVAGDDGLDCLRSIIACARRALRGGAWLLLEHGYDQGPAVRQLLAAAGYAAVETRHDFSGHERATGGRKP